MKDLVLIGYSGHAYVVAETALALGMNIRGYCDLEEKIANPYGLSYLGSESTYLSNLPVKSYFLAIGSNRVRALADGRIRGIATASVALIHPSAFVAPKVEVSELSLICAGATVQPLTRIQRGAIINTGARVDHECRLAAFSHIGPGAILTGQVVVGEGAFVGAGATVLPGLTIGAGAILGAGAVLTTDLPPGQIWVGNPARPIKSTDR